MDSFVDKIAQRLSGQDVIRANAEAEAAEMKRAKDHAGQLQKQLEQYDLYMQEMRKLCLRSTENAQDIRDLTEEARDLQMKIQNDAAEAGPRLERLTETIAARIEGLRRENDDKDEIITRLEESRRILSGYDEKLIGLTETMNGYQSLLAEIQETCAGQSTLVEGLRQEISGHNGDNEEIKTLLVDYKGELEEIVHKENVKVYRNVQAAVVEEMGKLSRDLGTEQEKAAGRNKAILILVIISLVAGLGSLGLMIVQILGIL